MKDWRIGLTVKPKYRTDPLYYESGKVLEVLSHDMFGNTGEENGFLKIQLETGRVIVRRADDWVTC